LIQKPAYIAGGTVSFKGTDLLGVPESKMRQARGRSISLVPQDSMSALNPVYTVGKQIVEAIRAHQRMSKSDAWKRGVQLLGVVGIPDPDERIKSYPHSMSGGMLQRVTIAMALAHEPELLILDEPTTALDVTIQAQILDLVRDLRARVNAAVLLITHDLGVVAESCDEVVVMYGGKVMEHSSTTAIMESPKHPYTVGLVASVPSLGTKGQQLRTIAGTVPNPLSMPPGCPFAPRCPHVMDKCATMPELRRMEDGRQIACWLD
jgi:peptide/nickel transport system ATP-binding protein